MSIRTEITLSKGGTSEHKTTMGQLIVPDMWHIAEAIRRRGSFGNPEATADQILECWHIAHDLKRHILEGPD